MWTPGSEVALLAEGVDRNMYFPASTTALPVVALLAEGVDRNLMQDERGIEVPGRPPRGGRG